MNLKSIIAIFMIVSSRGFERARYNAPLQNKSAGAVKRAKPHPRGALGGNQIIYIDAGGSFCIRQFAITHVALDVGHVALDAGHVAPDAGHVAPDVAMNAFAFLPIFKIPDRRDFFQRPPHKSSLVVVVEIIRLH